MSIYIEKRFVDYLPQGKSVQISFSHDWKQLGELVKNPWKG